jgi:protein-disulfide isomerase
MNARQAREKRRQEAAVARQKEAAAKKRKKLLAILAGAAAIVAVAIIITATSTSSGGDSGNIKGSASVTALFDGVAQKDMVVGRNDAPVTVVEYVDLQCPYCARFSNSVFPHLVNQYVRSGAVKIVVKPLGFLGPDSAKAGSAALEADAQGKGPQFVELFFRNQGEENTGYITPDFIRAVAEGIPGLDADRVVHASETAYNQTILDANYAEMGDAGLRGTPGFQIGPSDGRLEPFMTDPSSPAEFQDRINAALAESVRK